MEAPLDFILTRAMGIKSHLLSEYDYNMLISLPTFEDFITSLQEDEYQDELSQYFTPDDPITGLNRAIFTVTTRRLHLITKPMEVELEREIRRYQAFLDLKNLILLLYQFNREPDEESFMNISPGGTIPLAVWNELLRSESPRELFNKISILSPQLSSFDLSEMNPNSIDFTTGIIHQLNNFYFGKNKPGMIPTEPLSLVMLEIINKLVIRLAYRVSQLDQSRIETILELIDYWSNLPGFLANDLFEKDAGSWLNYLRLSLIDHLAKFSMNLSFTGDETYFEIYTSYLTIKILERQTRFEINQMYKLYSILYRILLEAQNLLWIGYGQYQKFPSELLQTRVIV